MNTEPCIIVIFGASGDLTGRKLVPALYEASKQGRLPEGAAIVGVSRTELSDEAFREKMHESCKKFAAGYDEALWPEFAKRIFYYVGDAASAESFPGLSKRLGELGRERNILKAGEMPNLLFYLSVSPNLYEQIVDNIGASGLVLEGHRWCSLHPEMTPWQRIIIEKPFGTDLASTISLNRCLGRVFEEEAIYRIDHYLGKELVQNMLVLRFANTIFEPIWNRQYVDHIQITAAETVGVGSRAANFYDTAGAVRDMIQSHLLQVLCMVAIEPPSVFDADAIMREKIKLVNSYHAPAESELASISALGRYGPTAATDKAPAEPAYVDEAGVVVDRHTETFGAVKLSFDNWRWSGVPFYIRSGKKLATKLSEVVVQFKKPPHDMFRLIEPKLSERPANRMVINIAPREGISLRIEGKVPGAGLAIDSAKLDFVYLKTFGGEVIEAYGPLIIDAIRGDRTLYKHKDEVEGGWRNLDPIINHPDSRKNVETYAAGSWGPAGSDKLISAGNESGGVQRRWHNPKADDVR